MNARIDPSQLPLPQVQPVAKELPLHDAEQLTHGGSQARITLNGQTYFLRITRAGKLILTK
ncbi:hemin uptake protein HemP [Tabrizicola sp. J26]|uniref:hemin uptake protein HemP n=1 Tax=Alitabrizicola rongguiensis TaxID=2909234 RepID=UPI001F1A583C|nr:hemin uptake protein HemP [Tabrizicola rongguiensis]MCF1708115.1 hemin uptake protein HemP [Tabrizicola rongguiensis]